MLLLAIDTSGKFGSIALGECKKETGCDVLGSTPLEGGTFSAELVPQIASLLEKYGFTKNNLDAFTVITGPGSFTGLRIGLTVVKALADTLGKPIAAASLLELMAIQVDMNGPVTAALDAGRGEIYSGVYQAKGTKELPTMIREELLTKEEFVKSASGMVITPEISIAELARGAGQQVKQIARPTSADLLRVGWMKMQAQILVSPETLDANYIRRTDAQRLLEGN